MKGLIIDHPDQVWVCDLTWIKLANGDEAYLAIIMPKVPTGDVFTRKIVGWALGRHLGHELPLAALICAFKRGRPEIHHSESGPPRGHQGVQYACDDYTRHLLDADVHISKVAL